VNSIFFNAIATVAITATLQPSLTQDQRVTSAPVSIASCSVVPTYEPVASSDSNAPSAPTGATLWVSFENRSARTLTDVTFLLETPDGAVMITDQGRFSSGVPIRHTLGPFADLQDDATCGLYSVRFDDGTTWQRP
jgi:hypothetical protein